MSRKSEELKAAEAAIRAFDFTQPIGCNMVLVYEFQSRRLNTEDCLRLIELCKEVTPEESQVALALDFKSRQVPDYDTTRGEFSAPYYVTECSDYRIIAWKRSKEEIEREGRIKAEAEEIKERADAEGISHAEAMMKNAIMRGEEKFFSRGLNVKKPESMALPIRTSHPVKDILEDIINDLIDEYATRLVNTYSNRKDGLYLEEAIIFFSRVLRMYNIDGIFRKSLEADLSGKIKFGSKENEGRDFIPSIYFYKKAVLYSDRLEIVECLEGLENLKEHVTSYRKLWDSLGITERMINNG